ncbi:hypothetical protein Tco_0730310 [Tanacetum coccineum]|uniref:Uncharacterized protein n=1 Tax=Tanacetum coccineum TaxID=301880 RepID=A0ABQ4YRF8_9ASTR
MGLWYPRESSFDLESYSDSDYAGADLDRKSTTGGCQSLGRRLITWHCKKQTIVATSTIESEYVAAASYCGQVLWIQNQMLDYGFNFMNTKIYIDNESTICIVKNPVYHSKTKHIAIRHHFIRDAYEKKLIQVWFDPPRDGSMSCLTTKGMRTIGAVCARRFRESLRRVTDGAEAFLILTLFILCLDKVSTDHAKLVPLGKVCTAKESLEKNTAKGTKCKLEPLISLTDDLSLLSNMAALESCPKHNMIAYLEKTEGNVEFHEVIDFLRRSYIYHALTVSPVVSTTFVEQFWTSAKSKTINNVRHITAKVAGKFVSISEASIRTDLIFDDADGIDSLPNQAIFDAIQLMGYEGDLTVLTFNKALFSPQWSEVPIEHAPDHPQDLHPCTIPDSIPNHMVIILEAKEIQALKAQITKLKKQAKLVIKHHKAYLKSVSLQQRFLRKSFSKKHNVHKESNEIRKIPLKEKRSSRNLKMKSRKRIKEKKIQERESTDKEVDYEILNKKYPIIDWKTKNLGTKPQFDKSKRSEEINMNVSWLVQDQTVLGKDYSNLLIADSLLKTIWFINAPCYENEALASPNTNELSIPEQTATGKGTSNPLMAAKKSSKEKNLLKKTRLLLKKDRVNLKIQKLNIKFRGGLLRLERLQGHLRFLLHSTVSMKLLLPVEVKTAQITTVSIKISTAGTYYCLCSVSAAGYKDTTVADLQLLEDLLLSRG